MGSVPSAMCVVYRKRREESVVAVPHMALMAMWFPNAFGN